MSLKDKLKKNKFVITCELAPPKGADIGPCLEKAGLLKDKVDAFNITDNQRSVMKLSSWALSIALLNIGASPIYQVTCRDRNRLAIQSDLLGAYALGIKNVLALTGDHPLFGDHPEAKSVFDLDSVQLLKIITILNRGADSVGNTLSLKTNFFAGAVVNPFSDNLDVEIIKLKKKIEKGAKFFQTQLVYDLNKFKEFIEKIKDLKIKIIAGVMPLKSDKMANFMNKNIPGVFIPQNLIEELKKSKNPHRTGMNQAIKIAGELKKFCNGIHIMSMGDEKAILEILKGI